MQKQAGAPGAGKSAVLAHNVMTADSGRAGKLVRPGESGGCYACESQAAMNLHLPRNQTLQDSRGDPLR